MPRVAVLLEPFPIRNTPNAFAWVGEHLGAMLLREDGGHALPDMRIVCGATAAAHLAGMAPAVRPYLVQPAAALQAAFMALAADWHTQGLRKWSAIQSGSAAFESLYEAVLLSVRVTYHFDVLAYWGTNETLRTVAARMGIPVLWAEYGPLRPPFATHFCLDPHGVNGLAGSRTAIAGDPAEQQPGLPSVALETDAGGVSAYEAALTLPDAGTADLDALLRFASGQRRVVLLAMQLSDDATIRLFGNGWTCRAMTEAVLDAQSAPGTVFILRPHPAEALTYHNQADGQAVRDMVADRPDVMVFDEHGHGAYLACLSLATEVVCVNSSVGFEAALLGKPVRVLGQASYTPAGAAPADLHGPAPRIADATLRRLLADHYVPQDRFWSLGFWRGAAAALPGAAEGAPDLPRLPTAEAAPLGRVRIGPGAVQVDGVGTLPLRPLLGCGSVDAVELEGGVDGTHLHVQGWGVDPATGTMLAGVLVTAGAEAVWSSACKRRPDVARHFGDPVRLASGFGVRTQLAHLGAALHLPVRLFGVTAAGHCLRLLPDWEFDPAANRFVHARAETEALPA